MKIRNGFVAAAVMSATLLFAYPSAWAGSPQQHRWEGVAIGVGAAILGSALIYHHGIHIYTPARMVHSPRAPFRHHHPEIRHRPQNHWKPYYRGHRTIGSTTTVGLAARIRGIMAPKYGNRFPFQGRDHRRGPWPRTPSPRIRARKPSQGSAVLIEGRCPAIRMNRPGRNIRIKGPVCHFFVLDIRCGMDYIEGRC
jgi:hypothetical protein